MGKLSIGKTVSVSTTKSAKAAGKAVKAGTAKAIKAGKMAMSIQMPNSLNWIYSFGFKVGVFLILKSFLILRYQFFNLRMSGFIMIACQFLQALVLIACGALMQNESLYDEPIKLRKISHYYGYALLLGFVTFAFREIFSWEFFREPIPSAKEPVKSDFPCFSGIVISGALSVDCCTSLQPSICTSALIMQMVSGPRYLIKYIS